jgi:hypothetical protein
VSDCGIPDTLLRVEKGEQIDKVSDFNDDDKQRFTDAGQYRFPFDRQSQAMLGPIRACARMLLEGVPASCVPRVLEINVM